MPEPLTIRSLRCVRLIVLTVLMTGSVFGIPEVVRADTPPEAPMLKDEIPEVDLSNEELLIDLFFDVKDDGELTLQGHQIRNDIPYPAVATPWFWAARVITFDNRCSQLHPLRDPTVTRTSDSQTHNEFWGKIVESTKLSVELAVQTDMQEVEIIDSSYESLGIFDVAVFIDSYCDVNPELTLCKNRKSKLILLDTDEGLNQFDISILDNFDSTEHLNRIDSRPGYRILSGNEEPVLAVNFDETVLTWALTHQPTTPFQEASRKAVYNGYRKYQDPESFDPDSSVVIDFETPALGVGFKLGILNYEQLAQKDEKALGGFDYLSELGEVPPVAQVEKVFEQLAISEKPVIVHLSAYDPYGKLINQKNKSILPVPGMYSFVGLVAPNNEIKSVVIDYKNIEPSAEEFLTDIVVFPLDAAKLPYRPLGITEQPCESAILLYTGEMSDFLPIDEAERLSQPEIHPILLPAKPNTPEPTVQPKPTTRPIDLSTPESTAVSCNSRGDQGIDLADVGWPIVLIGLFVYRAFKPFRQ